ncbi:hypothetical protein HMPREF0454_04228 [Hafnia alvei ATCC 51873]|uniref:Uncharacterized protein n=1 Tax=Hafnia alvei ATCC 51873 TaxID=1002364 RepID=G9YC95_HAFAL|nr:hypothetical protein HMPREF0454_04228 [Hafnia alvei ATCC 51873]
MRWLPSIPQSLTNVSFRGFIPLPPFYILKSFGDSQKNVVTPP